MNAKKIMIFILLQLSALGLMVSGISQADTQSDVAFSCGPGCHETTLSPSGYSVGGTYGGRKAAERSVSAWLTSINAMGNKCGFTAIGPNGTTSYQTAAEFLYAMQYVSTSSTSSTSTSTTNSTASTSTSTTTTTTIPTSCNAYVNGTTQFPYSGSGSCHSFSDDNGTGTHIVRDESYCKKHMSHLNSKGNHVHAYPHPACM